MYLPIEIFGKSFIVIKPISNKKLKRAIRLNLLCMFEYIILKIEIR